MPQKFVNLENLTSFWGNAKEYISNERKEIEDQLYNWQKTEKAPVVQCEPVPNSELHPIVEFKFKETLPEGDKSPSNPSTITGISSMFVKCTGKNLISLPYHTTPYTYNGITWTINSDNSVTANGTATADVNFYFTGNNTTELMLAEDKTYFLSGCPSGGSTSTYCLSAVNGANDTYTRVYDTGSGAIFKPKTSSVCIVHAIIRQGTTVNNITFKPQFEVGGSKTNYELTTRNQYTITLNDTYYGGTLDVATGKMKVTYSLVELNGETYLSGSIFEELADVYTVGFFPNPERRLTLQSNDDCACSCLPTTIAYGGQNYSCIHLAPSAMAIQINIAKTELGLGNGESGDTVRTAVHAWLAQHPGIIIYPVANPQTVQLTSQQIKSVSSLEGTSKRINTIYTDADSVQVEYQKYVGIDSTLDSDSVNAIQNKAVNSALNTKVSLSGDETISGTKTFSNTINGNITGDAGTVAGHIVSKDVPVNAAFTDTTYDSATQSTAGLMSASDKVKLDAVGSVFSFKGSVVNSSSLPASNNTNGDAYLAEDTGHVHVYDGSSFVDIGVWAGIPSATDAQIDALFED